MSDKMQSAALILSLISVWLVKYLPEAATNSIGYALILTIGIVHGANDIHLELKKNKIAATPVNSFTLLIRYISLIALTATVFYFFSAFALLFFILFSGYHFGEQHWQKHLSKTKKTRSIFFGLYGLMVLFLFFYRNPEDSQEVIIHLTGYTISPQTFTIAFIVSSLLFLTLAIFYIKEKAWNFWIRELFFILIFGIIFSIAPLIWAFAIYFIFWHSIPSLGDQIQFLYGGTEKKHIIKYAKQALVYWVISLVFIVSLVFLLKDQVQILTALLIAFLAAITIPHTLLMREIFKT